MKEVHIKPSIGVVILTLNAENSLEKCIFPFVNSPLKPKILVVDSESIDNTLAIAKKWGADILEIQRSSFNHGLTRERAQKHLRTDIVVMVTQDAHAVDESVLEKLIEPLLKNQATVSYARQIPHVGAGFFEAFPRAFNYPSQSHVRGISDISHYGVYTFFCSNSCAAYCTKALDSIGGFPDVLFGEDTVVVAKLLRAGHQIAYVAEAMVRHSHKYTLMEELRRYYNIGLTRKVFQDLISAPKGDQNRGSQYMREMMKQLLKKTPWLLPYGFLHILAKFFGYKLGQVSYYFRK